MKTEAIQEVAKCAKFAEIAKARGFRPYAIALRAGMTLRAVSREMRHFLFGGADAKGGGVLEI